MFQLEDISGSLGNWTVRTGPIYTRLADALLDAHSHGLLAGGGRLPAERLLAEHLGLSRGTVAATYDALRARGAAETRRGSGTYLRPSLGEAPLHSSPLLSRLVDGRQAPVDLSLGALQSAEGLGELTIDVASAARLLPSHGYAPLGASALRQAIAEHLTHRRGVPAEIEQVIVTAGAQGGLSLIAAALVRPGDRVLVEAPTYPGAIEVFSRAGAQVEGIERDHDGPVLASLESAVSSRPARLLYLVPTCHNPTGGVMSEARRHAILRIAAAANVTVIDDTVTADLIDGPVPPDFAAIDDANVITVGSLSKCVWGGLRIGWVRAPGEIVLRLGRIRAALDFGSPAFSQAVALAVFENFEEILAPVRARARERMEVLTGELASELPDWRFPMPAGGLSVWVTLPRGSGDQLAQLALRHGVAISAGSSASPDERFSAHLRLCAGPSPELIREGVRLLALAWSEVSTWDSSGLRETALAV
jgi:DNA-binding transcriptional MocR family regulator